MSAVGKTLELPAFRRDGSEFPVELSLSSAFERAGQWHAVGIIRDISARKEDEETLRQTLERQKAIFNVSLVGIMVQENRVITSVNLSEWQIFLVIPLMRLIGKLDSEKAASFPGRTMRNLAKEYYWKTRGGGDYSA